MTGIGLDSKVLYKEQELTPVVLEDIEQVPPISIESVPLSPEIGRIAEELIGDQIDGSEAALIEDVIDTILVKHSTSADLTILGFNLPAQGKEQEYVERMDKLLQKLPTALLVNCGFDIDLFS
jgi:hypothetical protein